MWVFSPSCRWLACSADIHDRLFDSKYSNIAGRALKRRFKEATDKNLIELLRNLRKEKAKRLPENQRLVIYGIRNNAGYEDNSFVIKHQKVHSHTNHPVRTLEERCQSIFVASIINDALTPFHLPV
jgi:AraC-like DNA-binding protein